jgi:ribose 1,5-bisphosphate isomerase
MILEDIRSMHIRSADRIAIAGLKYLKRYARKHGTGVAFKREMQRLVKIRPTAVVLPNTIEALKSDASIEKIDAMISYINRSKELIVKNGVRFFRHKTVMTHCESTEVEAILIAAEPKLVYATETRPMFQGFSTSKKLAAAGISVKLITDGACGFYLPECSAIAVGSDALRVEGVVNKIGTLPLAISAKEMKIPFYVMSNLLKIDRRKHIILELRSPNEIHSPMRGIKIVNPAFDITPWKYVTSVITECGAYKPSKMIKLVKSGVKDVVEGQMP